MEKAIIRRSKNRNYSVICNEVFKDKSLSLKAKGLYAVIMSLPDDWDFSMRGICELSKENYTAVNNAFKELEAAGYCKRCRTTQNGRITGYEYFFFENKVTEPCLEFAKDEAPNDGATETKQPKQEAKKSKVEEIPFEDFYKLYPLKKSKQNAERAWKKLKQEDRRRAIDALPSYIADCVREQRSFKHPSTYLNQRTWEDDFTTSAKVSFYDVLPTDDERTRKFKAWMRETYPNIEQAAQPLGYQDFMALYADYGFEEVEAQLQAINANIGKYKYSDINSIIRTNLMDY